MRLSTLFLLFVVCAFGALEAQRVYYQAGFPLAPARRLSLVNRQRVRLANGFSARLQQSTDDTEDVPSNNIGGGIGSVTNNNENETNDNNVDDEIVDDNSNKNQGSTKTLNSNDETTNRSNDVADSGDVGEAENNSEEVTGNDSKTEDKTSSTTESSVDDTSAEEITGNEENTSSNDDNTLNSVENKKKHDSSNGGHDDDSHNHGDSIEWLKDAIQGEPGVDYPIYSEIPATSFKCSEQKLPGYYGDVEAKCQVFHICQADGRMDSFLCPNGTIFAQNYFVCVWWHDFDCSTTESYYNLNENLYKKGKGIDGSDIILSPMDMISDVMNSVEKTGSDDEVKNNSIDGENETGEDSDSTEGDKFSKTSDNMGSINKKGLSSKTNTFNDFKPTNKNGLNNFNGKTNMSPGTVAGSSPSGKTNFNKGDGEIKTTEITPKKNIPNNQSLEPEDQSNNDDSDDGTNDNEVNKTDEVETSSVKSDDFVTSTEIPERGDGENTKTNEDENNGKSDSQQNVDENDMPVDKKNNDETSTIASDNFITENPAAEEVTDTPTESSIEEDGKDVPTSTENTQPEDVQVYENEESNPSGSARSRARFLLYRPRFKSVPLARVRVSTAARRPRFLPVISARNGVSRRFVAPKTLNKKKSKALRTNKKRSNVRRIKSPKKAKNRSGRQIVLNKKKSSHNSPKKATSHKKKNLKRANNRRKQTRSNARRRNNVRRSRSNRRSNRRLIVSGSTLSLRKQH